MAYTVKHHTYTTLYMNPTNSYHVWPDPYYGMWSRDTDRAYETTKPNSQSAQASFYDSFQGFVPLFLKYTINYGGKTEYGDWYFPYKQEGDE